MSCPFLLTLGKVANFSVLYLLPVTDDGEPDFQFMEDYIRELMTAKREQYQAYDITRRKIFRSLLP